MAIQQIRTPGSIAGGRKTVFASGLEETSTIDLDGVGAIRQEGDKFYKWVRYNNGTAGISAVAGLCVGYVSGTTTHEVTPDVSDTADLGAGVMLSAPANGEYCWIQTKGISGILSQDVTDPTAVIGQAVTLKGAADGEFDVSAAHTDFVIGMIIVVTSGSQQLWLDCPL